MSTLSVHPMRALFPVLLVGSPLASAGMIFGLGVPPAAAMTAVAFGVLGLVVALERRYPFHPGWGARTGEETRTDLAYILLASLPDRGVKIAAEALVVGALALCCGVGGQGPSLGESVARGLAAFLLADLAKYAIHRASHERPWLWRFHLAHHQPGRVDALNALRLHPVNVAYNAAADGLAMAALQVDPRVVGVFSSLRAVVGILQHANLDLDGQRQWIFNAPSYHRTHHSVDVAESNHNYASVLLVWDRLFSTLLRKQAPLRVGVSSDGALPEGYLGQTLHAFCGDALRTRCLFARVPWLVR